VHAEDGFFLCAGHSEKRLKAFFCVLSFPENASAEGSRDCLTTRFHLQRKLCRMVAKIVTL